MDHAQVGDTIVIRFEHSNFHNQEFVVCNRPESDTGADYENSIWFETDEGEYYFLRSTDMYEIVRRSNQSQQDVKDVDESLATQMDDNLRSIFS